MEIFVTVVLVAVGCGLTYVRLRGAIRQSAVDSERATLHRLDELASLVKGLEARVAELSKPAPALSVAAPAPAAKVEAAPAPKPVAAPAPPVQKEEPIPAELILVMAAAVTAFLGKKVRIRSAKMLQSPYEIVNPWAQQGRVFVQASHNLRG
jgi:outer membrane murein-binding lipoprotein Lpp